MFRAVLGLLIMGNTATRALSPATNPNYKLYDLVIIGGGSAGLTAAKFAATFGKSVVIVEEERLGGDCTWTGCVPSKSIIQSADVAHYARTASKYGVKVDNVQVDMKAVKERVRANIEKIYREDDSPEAMKKLGIDTIKGRATFTTPCTLSVAAAKADGPVTTIEAKEGVVVATGAKPTRPTERISGLENVQYLTYEEVFDLDELPAELTVVGGGPIGCELAQTFCRLGSKVTQVARKLIPKEEPEASAVLEEVFDAEGITLVRGSAIGVEADGKGHTLSCQLADGTTESVKGDMMLVAVGRTPNVREMGLEGIGVEFNERGGIDVNQKLQTSVKNVYAAGDCTGDKQFTHYAGYQGAIAARNILLPLTDPGVLDVVPATTFTSPEVGSVGLTEEQAKKEYGEDTVMVAIQYLDGVDRAVTAGEEKGVIKIVYHKKKFNILGASIVSPAAGEMISEISVAMKGKIGFDQLSTVMHAYPTYSIAIQIMAADVYYKKLAKQKPLLDFLKMLGL